MPATESYFCKNIILSSEVIISTLHDIIQSLKQKMYHDRSPVIKVD